MMRPLNTEIQDAFRPLKWLTLPYVTLVTMFYERLRLKPGHLISYMLPHALQLPLNCIGC